MALLIPVLSRTQNLLKELAKVLPNVSFHEVIDPETDQLFKKSEILICDFDLLGPHLYNLPSTKWVQGTWAGADALRPHFDEFKIVPYRITRFSGEHFGRLMSEYIIANIVGHERNLFQVRLNQQQQQWSRDGKISSYRVISDLTVGILGLGIIGKKVGKILHTLGATVAAFVRPSHLSKDIKNENVHVTKYYTTDALPALLEECDYIINILPQTPETNGLLDNDILKNCAVKQSVLINVGRGNIVSEDAIIKALHNKWISAAILDVFDNEPLPSDSRLWRTENVFITPHVSAMSRAKDIAEQFCSNLELYKKNLPLPAVIDLTKGY